jgi:RimJ/RimL family protein N-acetyltransferase
LRKSTSRRAQSAPAIRRRRGGAPWTETLLLPNGRELLLRPIVPADARALREGFAVLSPEEVRARFLYPMAELGEGEAQRLAGIDPAREFALVAAEPLPPGEALVGAIVRANLDPDSPGDAEFALLVARPLSGQGLGTLLMRQVLSWARRRRLRRLHGTVLADNEVMLHLAHGLGFVRSHVHGEPGTLRIEIDLHKTGRRAS